VSAVHEIGSEVHSVQDRFLADEGYHVGSGNGATYASSMLQREKSHGLKDGMELTVGARVARDGPASSGPANDLVITACGLMVSSECSAERYRAKKRTSTDDDASPLVDGDCDIAAPIASSRNHLIMRQDVGRRPGLSTIW